MIYIFSKKKIIIFIALFITSALIVGALYISSVTAETGVNIDEIALCMEQVRQQESGGGEDEIMLFTDDINFGDCDASTRVLGKILNCDPRTQLGGSDGTCGAIDIESPRFGTFMQQSVGTFQLLHSISVTRVADSDTRDVLKKLTQGIVSATSVLSGTLGGGVGFGAGLPFGGLVSFVQPCTCSCGAVVVVGPPRGGPFLYCPATAQVFEYFQIPRIGVWLLGLYSPGGVCLINVGKLCVPAPIQPQGTIQIVGTSF